MKCHTKIYQIPEVRLEKTEALLSNGEEPMKKCLSVKEVAEALGVTERAVWQRIYRGNFHLDAGIGAY